VGLQLRCLLTTDIEMHSLDRRDSLSDCSVPSRRGVGAIRSPKELLTDPVSAFAIYAMGLAISLLLRKEFLVWGWGGALVGYSLSGSP